MFPEILKRAISSGNFSEVERLTRGGKYLTVKNSNGNTPLHIAALCGNYQISKLLLERFHDRALHSEFTEEKMERILRNREGKTPLHLAVERRNFEFIRALKELEDVVGLRYLLKTTGNLFGNLPVHVAAATGNVRALKEFSGQIHAVNGEGNTPLHKAVEKRQKEAVKFLLESGADRKVENDQGLTPEELARFLGYEEIVEVFQEIGEVNREPEPEVVTAGAGNGILIKNITYEKLKRLWEINRSSPLCRELARSIEKIEEEDRKLTKRLREAEKQKPRSVFLGRKIVKRRR